MSTSLGVLRSPWVSTLIDRSLPVEQFGLKLREGFHFAFGLIKNVSREMMHRELRAQWGTSAIVGNFLWAVE